MNEIAMQQPATAAQPSSTPRKSNAFYGYALTILALEFGWLLRDRDLMTAKSGVGYGLGIVGGSMMLLLLLYPLRKRFRVMRILGNTAFWFKTHMILGVLGPVLVLYHSGFQLGSFNSKVALFCMLLVAGSGVIGRHIYAHIHRGLYGEKTSLRELRNDLQASLEQSHGLATLLPGFTARLESLTSEVEGDELTGHLGTRASLLWTIRQYWVWWSLSRTANNELRARALESEAVMEDLPRLKKSTSRYVRRFVKLSGRVAQFTLYERMFSLWHVLHLPLFLMMIISASVHVLAVHMY